MIPGIIQLVTCTFHCHPTCKTQEGPKAVISFTALHRKVVHLHLNLPKPWSCWGSGSVQDERFCPPTQPPNGFEGPLYPSKMVHFSILMDLEASNFRSWIQVEVKMIHGRFAHQLATYGNISKTSRENRFWSQLTCLGKKHI